VATAMASPTADEVRDTLLVEQYIGLRMCWVVLQSIKQDFL
jgi:hypothetical protein